MTPIASVNQVFEVIQEVKAGAPAYCTNFFPVQKKLQGWIDRGELRAETRKGSAFFLRSDRGFQHLYFCAASLAELQRDIAASDWMKTERLTMDLVGNEASLAGMLDAFEAGGFRRYSKLQRLARASQPLAEAAEAAEQKVVPAEAGDCDAVLELLDSSFDKYADQLPTAPEIEEAIRDRQIVLIKSGGELAALLHFETQGFTSTIRYWVVAAPFRSQRLGSVLMRHYFTAQSAVRRFILWVVGTNDDAIRKYKHFGYAPDGLVDHVLANAALTA